MSNAELVANIAHILDPWAFETKSYNATIARDDATDKATQIVEALAALDSRAGDAGEGESANRVIYLLQGDNSRMAEALRSCRDQFAFYASEHTAAGKSEKAATNARFAKIADDALTAIRPATPAPAVDAVPAGEVERLREALTPSGDTKAAYHGEFRFDVMFPSLDEDDDEPVPHPVMVPWDTVKEIMAAISSRAALSHGEDRK